MVEDTDETPASTCRNTAWVAVAVPASCREGVIFYLGMQCSSAAVSAVNS